MAGDFQSRQDLIAGLPQFRDSLLALLDSLTFPAEATAIEVGPGDGGFLAELSSRFQQVRALDNSPQMLELARQTCTKHGLHNVQLQLADALHDDVAAADCVVVNIGTFAQARRQFIDHRVMPTRPRLGQAGLRRSMVRF